MSSNGNTAVSSSGTTTTKSSGSNIDIMQIISDANITIVAWFLAVYFIIYLLLNILRGNAGAQQGIVKWFDIATLTSALVYLVLSFFSKTDAEKSAMLSSLYGKIKEYMNTPISLLSIGFFILVLYVFIYVVGLPMDASKPISISIVENSAWLLFVAVMISTFFSTFMHTNLTDLLDNTVKERKHWDNSGNLVAKNAKVELPAREEVFNIGNNMYTYDDAQSVCASFGARLATYDEVENAYNQGAEWCNYGWSDGQAAYFPTQKATWDKLQKSESTKHSCGRPGVNGGYIANPDVRFGVNCFGVKPKPKTKDLDALGTGPTVPKTPEDLLLEKKVKFWKDNGDKLFKINGYNNNKWSQF